MKKGSTVKKDEDCIFCKIIAGVIPSAKVYEDERVYAFLDIVPINFGHTLVVPKNHSKNILEDDDEDVASCMKAITKVAKAMLKATSAQGFNLGVNTEKAAGQAVFHTHFHVIPRFDDDGLHHWPGKRYPEGEMEKVRDRIVRQLSQK